MSREGDLSSGEEMADELDLKMLEAGDIAAIDHALEEIGPFGEVHLVVEDSHLRFIRTVRSDPVITAQRQRTKSRGK